MITTEQLAEWKRLADAATPGPWEAPLKDLGEIPSFEAVDFYFDHSFEAYPPLGFSGPIFVASSIEDAAFIAAARLAMPALCQLVREQQTRLAKMQNLARLNLEHANQVTRELRKQQAKIMELETMLADMDKVTRFGDNTTYGTSTYALKKDEYTHPSDDKENE